MRNTAAVRHYFMEAFTPYGYISMLGETMRETKSAYVLAGGPGTGKSTMIKLIGIQLIDRGIDVDYIRSAREPDSVAGLYLPKYKLWLIDEKEFLLLEIGQRPENYRRIGFDSFCRQSKLQEYQGRIQELENDLRRIEGYIVIQLHQDYPPNAQAENITISLQSLLNARNAKKETSPYNEVEEILSKVKKNCLSYCFLHALQLDGWLNLAPRYIKDYDRIFLEGGDSSNILIDLLQEVTCLGQVIEIIVNPLKPDAVLGIVFPEKNLAVWKGNPSRIEDQGFRKKHSSQLLEILEKYKTVRSELKALVNETVNFRGLDDLRSELLSMILSDLIPCP